MKVSILVFVPICLITAQSGGFSYDEVQKKSMKQYTVLDCTKDCFNTILPGDEHGKLTKCMDYCKGLIESKKSLASTGEELFMDRSAITEDVFYPYRGPYNDECDESFVPILTNKESTGSKMDSNKINNEAEIDSNKANTRSELDSNKANAGSELDSNKANTGSELDSNKVNARSGIASNKANASSELDSNLTSTTIIKESETIDSDELCYDSTESDTPKDVPTSKPSQSSGSVPTDKSSQSSESAPTDKSSRSSESAPTDKPSQSSNSGSPPSVSTPVSNPTQSPQVNVVNSDEYCEYFSSSVPETPSQSIPSTIDSPAETGKPDNKNALKEGQESKSDAKLILPSLGYLVIMALAWYN